MKIVAVSTVKDEADIIGKTIEHLRKQGVDDFLISLEVNEDYSACVKAGARTAAIDLPFDQGYEITSLALWAEDIGADWILPFDADEFWCATDPNLTVRDVLLCTKSDIDAIYAPMYLHITPEERAVDAKPLPKVCFRPNPDMTVSWGSHNVTGVSRAVIGPLLVRELQYQSLPHFLAKIEKARQLHSQPHMASHEHGTHMWRLCNMTDTELRAEWERHLATPTIIDPIPGLAL